LHQRKVLILLAVADLVEPGPREQGLVGSRNVLRHGEGVVERQGKAADVRCHDEERFASVI